MLSDRRNPQAGLQFFLLCLVWGASFFFVKVGLEGLSAPAVVIARLWLGAFALCGFALVSPSKGLPGSRAILHLVVEALLLCDVPYALIAWSEQHISSSLASLFNAATPLMAALVALVVLAHERATPSLGVGLALGFAGVVVVLAPWSTGFGSARALPSLASLLAAACYGAGFVYWRRFLSPLNTSATTLAAGLIALAALFSCALIPFAHLTTIHLTSRVVLAMLGLGVLGTGAAYIWNANVIASWGAHAAATITYVLPVVGIALGVVGRGERFVWTEAIGTAVIISGIAMTRARSFDPRPALGAAVSATPPDSGSDARSVDRLAPDRRSAPPSSPQASDH